MLHDFWEYHQGSDREASAEGFILTHPNNEVKMNPTMDVWWGLVQMGFSQPPVLDKFWELPCGVVPFFFNILSILSILSIHKANASCWEASPNELQCIVKLAKLAYEFPQSICTSPVSFVVRVAWRCDFWNCISFHRLFFDGQNTRRGIRVNETFMWAGAVDSIAKLGKSLDLFKPPRMWTCRR